MVCDDEVDDLEFVIIAIEHDVADDEIDVQVVVMLVDVDDEVDDPQVILDENDEIE